LNAAIKIQTKCNEVGGFKLSIGIHLGEVVVDKGDIFGDAVNVASRIRALGTAGSVLFSDKVADEVKNKAEFKAVSLGRYKLKMLPCPWRFLHWVTMGFRCRREARSRERSCGRGSPYHSRPYFSYCSPVTRH
jgi:class 3 adenylate cyclase